MTNINRCPRCGCEVEGDFCPRCDLHSNKKGVYRTEEDKQRIAQQTNQWLAEKEQQEEESAQSSEMHVFPDEEMDDEPFSKEVFNKTVGEILAEQNDDSSEPQCEEEEVVTEGLTLKQGEDDAVEENSSCEEQMDENDEDIDLSGDIDSNGARLLDEEEELLEEDIEDNAIKEMDESEVVERLALEEAKKEADIPEDYVPDDSIQKPDLSDEAPKKSESRRFNQKHVIWTSIIVMVVALLIGGGVTGYQYYHAKQLEATKEQRAIVKQINRFYIDQNPQKGFLAKKVGREQTQTIRDRIDKLAKMKPDQAKQLDKDLATVQSNQELMDKVNQLFVSTKIKGDHIYNPSLKEDQSIQLVEMKHPKTDFDRAVNESISDAKKQEKQMKLAQKAVDKVYSKGVVSPDATNKEYDDAKKAVDEIKNEEMKNRLLNQLKQVKDELDRRNKEKEAQKKKEKQEKFAKETAKERSQAQKITGDRQYSDVDEDSSAWDWAPGIKDKVINTCLQRGYITQGGYELRKAYVIGNDGYYNLYGTNNQSSLLRGYSASELPVYLVTINCKTGWFKGGGAN